MVEDVLLDAVRAGFRPHRLGVVLVLGELSVVEREREFPPVLVGEFALSRTAAVSWPARRGSGSSSSRPRWARPRAVCVSVVGSRPPELGHLPASHRTTRIQVPVVWRRGCRHPDQQRASVGVDHGDAQDQVRLQAEAVLGEHRLLLAPERAIEAVGCCRRHHRRRPAVDGVSTTSSDVCPVLGLGERVCEVVIRQRGRRPVRRADKRCGEGEPDAAVDPRALPGHEVGQLALRVPVQPSRQRDLEREREDVLT